MGLLYLYLLQFILRFRSDTSNICLLWKLYNTVLKNTQFIHFPKEVCSWKNKQIIAIFWIMWTSSQLQYAWRGIQVQWWLWFPV